MANKLKRDQLPAEKAKNWKKNFKEETEKTFNLKLTPIILQKETYKSLIGENENRVRVYLGLEPEKDGDKYVLCAYAVSSFLLGSGDVYADYETPVYKLSDVNKDFSDKTDTVIESIRLYRKWRDGEIDQEDAGAAFRQYIYPNAYLLTKFELHELFNSQNNERIKIEFGIQKTMDVMISAVVDQTIKSADDGDEGAEEFNNTGLCPPYCDERSIYNS
ncbi:hypothetical protein SLH46_17085 [Draconibacterium sp. IB214405]|uniref:hypothetical protein n=1 Tax=Draconibacterium sp. IB214405 TaxID=3097352 RepID=UPI002A13126D|nr:hypothetical protein [Draconibacterium sp. IB214405]MDX8340916.1 hypothetical protein [Draconibacterium sp. IB214405]